VLFGAQTVESITRAMLALEADPPDGRTLRSLAEPFAAERFDAEFQTAFERHYAAWQKRRTAAASPESPSAQPRGPGAPASTVAR
jgi:hypothetical protein